MAKFLKPMTEAERENALMFLDITMQSLLRVVNSPEANAEQVERAYDLLAESVLAKARVTSMKGVNHD